MNDKIIQISGFGVENNSTTQCSYMIVGLTESGKVVISQGDGKWADISPKASQPTIEPDAVSLCHCGKADCENCGDGLPALSK